MHWRSILVVIPLARMSRRHPPSSTPVKQPSSLQNITFLAKPATVSVILFANFLISQYESIFGHQMCLPSASRRKRMRTMVNSSRAGNRVGRPSNSPKQRSRRLGHRTISSSIGRVLRQFSIILPLVVLKTCWLYYIPVALREWTRVDFSSNSNLRNYPKRYLPSELQNSWCVPQLLDIFPSPRRDCARRT